jgi:hypothetical protein
MATNLLTANQADGTDTSSATTGLVTTGAGATVTSSTAQKKSGSRSIKVVCAGSGTGEGVKTTTTALTLYPEPMTFTASVYSSVAVSVKLEVTSSNASFTASTTVTSPGAAWTTIYLVATPGKNATDGVLTVKTAETKACDLYVDELGSWVGHGGQWAPSGKIIPGQGGVNSNQIKYYAGLAPISDLEENAIAAGTADAQIDWVP